jgi:hypothetical protein
VSSFISSSSHRNYSGSSYQRELLLDGCFDDMNRGTAQSRHPAQE